MIEVSAAELLGPALARLGLAAPVQILLPARIPLDVAGETIRARLLMVSDPLSGDWCLRPDLTLPIVLHYLDGVEAPGSGAGQLVVGPACALTALGPVFRQPLGAGEAGEFVQAGFERFSSAEPPEQADAALLADTLDLCRTVLATEAGSALTVVVGDAGLIADICTGMGLDRSQQAHVQRHHARPETLMSGLTAAPVTAADAETGTALRLAALLSDLPAPATGAALSEIYALAGLEQVGGRTAQEIADRLNARARRGASRPVPRSLVQALIQLFEVDGPFLAACHTAADIARRLGASQAADRILARADAIGSALGPNVTRLHFSARAGFGSRFSYYDGMMFSVLAAGLGTARPIAAGGRYDALVGRLSSQRVHAAALGAALRLDRIDLINRGARR